ncbi:MAG: tRNA (cytidine(34)-2'-O)-methyltransferase [Bacilli bacterium]
MINIVLYQPEISGNTGNIMRTCVATNSHLHLIKPLGFSLEEKYIKRSAVNYIKHLNYTVYENFEEFENKNNGVYYYLTRYGKKTHSSFDYSHPNENVYFIFGKESTGIPKEILRKHLNNCIRIPSSANVRSLNLSNSVAIILYEVLRQQNFNDLMTVEPHKGEDFLTQ